MMIRSYTLEQFREWEAIYDCRRFSVLQTRYEAWRSGYAHDVAHNVAVIWDEDRDERVLYCLDQIRKAGALPNGVMAIGERKAMLHVWQRSGRFDGDDIRHFVGSGAEFSAIDDVPSGGGFDSFSLYVERWGGAVPYGYTESELVEIDHKFALGPRRLEGWVDPFDNPF